MNRDQFYTYLENPALLNENTLKMLEEVLTEYPYFQTAHILYLKNLHEIGHLKFNKQLRISSTYVLNRELLYEFLHPGSKEYTSMLSDSGTQIIKAESATDKTSPPQTITPDKNREIEDNQNQASGIRKQLGNELLKKINQDPKHILNFIEFESNNTRSQDFFHQKPEAPLNIEPDQIVKEDPETSCESGTGISESLHSFSEWLHLLSEGNIEKPAVKGSKKPKDQISAGSQKKSQENLIDKFIEAQPRIKANLSTPFQEEDISKESIAESDDFITETLANIYIGQKHYNKAILAYEKLSLKYPEKNIYFAHQIKKIKDLKNE